jgi:ectoine hydroxylase-related dioxygenase (phytanoyl-CoA dioxygenase family)
MDDWFSKLDALSVLPAGAVQELRDVGFIVIPGPVAPDRMTRLAEAYDSGVAGASSEDRAEGSTTTRVHDFVNRGPEFDSLYIYEPILEACCRVIGQPFRLSSLLARTVRPGSADQGLHVDFERQPDGGWPMLGFILMVDEFREDNGATRFVPGSHGSPTVPTEGQVLACGPPGSVIVYNGSVWHGHTANRTAKPRRSLQGAYIRRNAESWINRGERIRPETLGRIGNLAKYLLAL